MRAGKQLFHGGINVQSRAPGWVAIHTSRNFRSDDAVCDLISRFPKLRFLGCVHSDMGYGNGGEYTTFFGIGGTKYVEDRINRNVEGDCKMTTSPTNNELVNEVLQTLGELSRQMPAVSLINDENGKLDHVVLIYLGASAELASRLDSVD
jgi:hypothetical protein